MDSPQSGDIKLLPLYYHASNQSSAGNTTGSHLKNADRSLFSVQDDSFGKVGTAAMNFNRKTVSFDKDEAEVHREESFITLSQSFGYSIRNHIFPFSVTLSYGPCTIPLLLFVVHKRK